MGIDRYRSASAPWWFRLPGSRCPAPAAGWTQSAPLPAAAACRSDTWLPCSRKRAQGRCGDVRGLLDNRAVVFGPAALSSNFARSLVRLHSRLGACP